MGESEIIEITVRDCFGSKLESFKVMKDDFPKVVKIICNKFGLKIEEKKEKEDKDLDWAV